MDGADPSGGASGGSGGGQPPWARPPGAASGPGPAPSGPYGAGPNGPGWVPPTAAAAGAGYLSGPPSPRRKPPSAFSPGLVIALVVLVAVVAGAIWFVASRRSSDAPDRASKVDAPVSTTAAVPTTVANTLPPDNGQGDLPGPNAPDQPTGSKAKLCALSADFDKAVSSADQVDGATTPESAEALAKSGLGTWMTLVAATPKPVFEEMVRLFDQQVSAAYWTERSGDEPGAPGVLSAREIWDLYKASGPAPTSQGPDVAAVRTYLSSC